MKRFHRSFVRVALVLAIAVIANGGVSADLTPRIFEEDSEGVLWETLPAFGRSSAACEWADVTPDNEVGHPVFDPNGVLDPTGALESLRDLGAPLHCPGAPSAGPIFEDQLFDPRGVALFDPGAGVGEAVRLQHYRVYAADTLNHRIVGWDYFGGNARAFGTGVGPVADDGSLNYGPRDDYPDDQLFYPEGITTDASGNILVADQYNGRISVFTPANPNVVGSVEEHWYVKSLPPDGAPRGHRAMPSHLAVKPGVSVQAPATPAECTTSTGAVAVAVTTWTPWFVADDPATDGTGMSQVLVYDSKWCLIEALGNVANLIDPEWGVDAEWPSPRGSFWMPNQLAFDPDGRLYVADSANYKVEVFDAALNPLLMICNPTPSLFPHADCVNGTGVIATTELTGSYGLVIDNRPAYDIDDTTGAVSLKEDVVRLVLANHRDHEVSVFEVDFGGAEPDARFAFRLRAGGGLVGYPRSMAQDKNGRYFVAVPGLDKIQLFDIPQLAIVEEEWQPIDGNSPISVAEGDDFWLTFSITVPALKPTVLGVVPTISWEGPASAVGPLGELVGSPVIEEVFGPLPATNLEQARMLTYKVRFRATAATLPEITFTVGAKGDPSGEEFLTLAPEKSVIVPIVCATCEQDPPVISASPLGTPMPFYDISGNISPLTPVYRDGRVNLIASDPLGAISGEASGISKITYWFEGAEQFVQPGVHTLLINAATVLPADSSVDLVGRTLTSGNDALITLTRSGLHTIRFQTWDGFNNPSEEGSLTLLLDVEAPSVGFTVSPASVGADANLRSWWNANVTATPVNPADNMTQDEDIDVSPSSLLFTSEGVDQTQTVDSEDLAGNVGTNRSPVISIDKTAPVTSVSPAEGDYQNSVTVTLTTADALSGVRTFQYRLLGASCAGASPHAGCTPTTVNGTTASFTITAAGQTTVEFSGTDWATNVEVTKAATYTIELNGPPDAVDDGPITVIEDTPLLIPVLANDTDADGDTLTVVNITDQPDHGAITMVSGLPRYTPAANYVGADSFSYRISDGQGPAGGYYDTATVTIVVTATVDEPNAAHDARNTLEDTPVNVTPLDNDSNPDGDVLVIQSFSNPANGSVERGAAGVLVYTPNPQFYGSDSFTYMVVNAAGLTDGATVTITVTSVDDPVVAVDDTATTSEETAVTIAVRNNDSVPDGGAVVTGVTQPLAAQGTVAIVAGNPVYTPATNFFGTATFTYTVEDADGDSDTATVTVTVIGTDDLPTAANDSTTTNEDTPVTIDVVANDSDPDHGGLTVTAFSAPPAAQGTVVIVANRLVFTPADDFFGTVSFTYTMTDVDGDAATATVTITVSPTDDAPTAADDATSTTEDTPVTIDVIANDADPDQGGLTVTAVSAPPVAEGTAAIVSNQVVFTPVADFFGTSTFTYTIADADGDEATATVTVTIAPSDDLPTAVNDSATVNEDTAVTIDVVVNDVDPDQGGLTVTTVTQPPAAQGTVTIVGNRVVFTPAANFAGGPVLFTYTVADADGDEATATVSITVTAINDPPDAVNDTTNTTEDTPIVITVLGNDTDVDGLALTVTSTTPASHGGLTRNANGTITYTPESNWYGTDTFTYTISDGRGGTDTATVTVTVTPVNDQPSAYNNSYTVVQGQTLTIPAPGILADDSDPDGDTLTASAITAPGSGSLSVNSDGSFSYGSSAAFSGPVSFQYRATDPSGAFATATVTITVTPIVPTAVNDSYVATYGQPLNIGTPGVLSNDNANGGSSALSVTLVSGPANGSVVLQTGGSFSYTPNPGFAGTDSFVYRIAAGTAVGNTATVTIRVNRPPVANNDNYTIIRNQTLTIAAPGVMVNDSDPDNNPITTSAPWAVSNGSVTLNPNGSFVFIPTTGFTGTASFRYRVTDDVSLESNEALVTITVNPEAPVAVNDTYHALRNTVLNVQPAGILTNDTANSTNPLTITVVSQPTSGSVVVQPNGSFAYTPANNFLGTVTFTYRLNNGIADSNVATVTIKVQSFRSQSQGGWGNNPSGSNPGAFLHANFATVYPNGLTIGGTRTLTFTSAQAITDFLPAGGTASVLSASAVNPTNNANGGGVFAGQLLAAKLAADFSTADVTRQGIAALKIRSGDMAGYTVAQVISIGNQVIGGTTSALPSGITISKLSNVLEKIALNFENGTTDRGNLIP